MATCNDCIHFGACASMLGHFGYDVNDAQKIEGAEKRCDQFAEKARFVELPCKIGDTVWVLNCRLGEVFENTVTGIYIKSESDAKNHVTLKHINKLHAESYRSYTFRQFGRTVFYSREKAEAALVERREESENENLRNRPGK